MQIVPLRSANRYISHAYIYIYFFSFKNPADSQGDLYVAKFCLGTYLFSLRKKTIDHAKSTWMDGYFTKGRYKKKYAFSKNKIGLT